MENINLSEVKQPVPNGVGTPIVDLVMRDLIERKEFGTKKYGEPLKAFNARNSLLDAYQEALDLCIYLRQKVEEESQMDIAFNMLYGFTKNEIKEREQSNVE